jgi:hypothetical protein
LHLRPLFHPVSYIPLQISGIAFLLFVSSSHYPAFASIYQRRKGHHFARFCLCILSSFAWILYVCWEPG